MVKRHLEFELLFIRKVMFNQLLKMVKFTLIVFNIQPQSIKSVASTDAINLNSLGIHYRRVSMKPCFMDVDNFISTTLVALILSSVQSMPTRMFNRSITYKYLCSSARLCFNVLKSAVRNINSSTLPTWATQSTTIQTPDSSLTIISFIKEEFCESEYIALRRLIKLEQKFEVVTH
jgi:hypothetical protein